MDSILILHIPFSSKICFKQALYFNSEGMTPLYLLYPFDYTKYIHQLYQTSSFHVTSVTSHMILKVKIMIFKQIFTCFKLVISKTKDTLSLQFFVLAFKKFRFQHPSPLSSLPYGRTTVLSPHSLRTHSSRKSLATPF